MKALVATKANNATKALKRVLFALTTFLTVSEVAVMRAFAFGDQVQVTGQDIDANVFMGKIIGILLTITRYVGVALVIYGVYEIVMSFMQNQPEAKTKGIIMALAGVVMVALKSVLRGLGVIV